MESEVVKFAVKWLFHRPSRLRLFGYRPEVICFIRSSEISSRILIVRSRADPSYWAPPQEGIDVNETVQEAAHKCLEIELGLEESRIQFRRHTWIGTLELPEKRWDERDLRYSIRRVIGPAAMIGKGYYAALIIADSSTEITPNSAEIVEWKWVDESDFQNYLEAAPDEKRKILHKAWHTFATA